MSTASLPWVIVVIADPSKRPTQDSARILEEPEAMLRRALSLATLDRVCCVIADPFLHAWVSVYDALRPANRVSLSLGEPVLEGVKRCLISIGARDSSASVTVIPYNHCAVEEVSWLDSTKGALRLGGNNRNTVYMLHDNPENDRRVALKKPEVCSSSVMVGACRALLALCLGKQTPTVVDLVADAARDPAEQSSTADTAINVVHVRLIEEYSRLQRRDVWHRPAQQVNVQA